jgi:hypothetical protein
MQGLELARLYWEEAALPQFKEKLPGALPHMAAGLCGEGSECFGFDDHISQDHDWGPGVIIWITRKDALLWENEIRQLYATLPRSFRGFPPRREMPGNCRMGCVILEDWFRRLTGFEKGPQSLDEWMIVPESHLAMVTNGEVFYDPVGVITKKRLFLKGGYPRDVWLSKMAHELFIMAQAGQYNYKRALARRDLVAMSLAKNAFLLSAMKMVYLLNRVYAPFYKWIYRGLEELSETYGTSTLFRELVKNAEAEDSVTLIEIISSCVAGALQDKGLVDDDAGDFLTYHALALQKQIKDGDLRRRNIMEDTRLWKR